MSVNEPYSLVENPAVVQRWKMKRAMWVLGRPGPSLVACGL